MRKSLIFNIKNDPYDKFNREVDPYFDWFLKLRITSQITRVNDRNWKSSIGEYFTKDHNPYKKFRTQYKFKLNKLVFNGPKW